ncbi:MAG: DHA2 family efflux MFS transporter permease subunit [Hyphomicrobiaceae bacterium]|nr:DHA2 family efflux MFS transporter permease subunit [Hyphomicrobiaceae bacterium]
MSNDGTAPGEVPPLRRMLVLLSVVLATTLYSTTVLIVSTVLPQMQGTFSATADEVSWVVTFNILATAIVTPMTGWLTGRFGIRNVMIWSVLGFTLATLMCGFAVSLESLVFWRIVQGALGAPSTPLAQSILMDTFPRRQHAMAMGLFGFGVVIGPVIGPTLGGYMAEQYSWRYAFYAIFPVGLLGVLCLRIFLPKGKTPGPRSLDWTGFLTLSAALAATQLVLSRGQRLDWLDSVEIRIEILIAVVTFWIFAAHIVTTRQPFLEPRHLLNRNYAIGLILVTIYGMLNFTPVVLLPPLLKAHVHFPETLVGEIVASRGAGGCIGFLIGSLAGRLDPRVSMITGFGMLLAAGLWLMTMDLNVRPSMLALNAALQGVAAGTLWVPLTVVTFSNVAEADRAETSAVFHLLRNLGSSFFISACVAEIVRSTGVNYSRMIEGVSAYNPSLSLPWVVGAWDVTSAAGLQTLANEITRQSALIAHLNVFGMFSLACAVTIPLILLLGGSRPKGAAGAAGSKRATS